MTSDLMIAYLDVMCMSIECVLSMTSISCVCPYASRYANLIQYSTLDFLTEREREREREREKRERERERERKKDRQTDRQTDDTHTHTHTGRDAGTAGARGSGAGGGANYQMRPLRSTVISSQSDKKDA